MFENKLVHALTFECKAPANVRPNFAPYNLKRKKKNLKVRFVT